MNILFRLTLIIAFPILISCNDNYNDTVKWISSLDSGATIAEVRKSQPEFIKIDWDHPSDTLNNAVLFPVIIHNNPDVLNMRNGLLFVNGKYTGRYVHK